MSTGINIDADHYCWFKNLPFEMLVELVKEEQDNWFSVRDYVCLKVDEGSSILATNDNQLMEVIMGKSPEYEPMMITRADLDKLI